MKTNVASTSIRQYNSEAFNILGESQRTLVLSIVQLHEGGLTRREIAALTDLEVSSVAGRVNELVRRGELMIPSKVFCPLSGIKVGLVKVV